MHKINPAQDREGFEEIDVLVDFDGDIHLAMPADHVHFSSEDRLKAYIILDPREIKELYDYIQRNPRSNSILERFRLETASRDRTDRATE